MRKMADFYCDRVSPPMTDRSLRSLRLARIYALRAYWDAHVPTGDRPFAAGTRAFSSILSPTFEKLHYRAAVDFAGYAVKRLLEWLRPGHDLARFAKGVRRSWRGPRAKSLQLARTISRSGADLPFRPITGMPDFPGIVDVSIATRCCTSRLTRPYGREIHRVLARTAMPDEVNRKSWLFRLIS